MREAVETEFELIGMIRSAIPSREGFKLVSGVISNSFVKISPTLDKRAQIVNTRLVRDIKDELNSIIAVNGRKVLLYLVVKADSITPRTFNGNTFYNMHMMLFGIEDINGVTRNCRLIILISVL